MHAVLVGAESLGDGRMAFTFSQSPGRRVTIVGPADVNTEDLAAELAATVAPIIGRHRTETETPQ